MTLNKQKIKEEIIRWLQAHGWPNMFQPDLFVVNNLDPIFAHLLSLGLVRQDMYDNFVVAATTKWQEKVMGF